MGLSFKVAPNHGQSDQVWGSVGPREGGQSTESEGDFRVGNGRGGR